MLSRKQPLRMNGGQLAGVSGRRVLPKASPDTAKRGGEYPGLTECVGGLDARGLSQNLSSSSSHCYTSPLGRGGGNTPSRTDQVRTRLPQGPVTDHSRGCEDAEVNTKARFRKTAQRTPLQSRLWPSPLLSTVVRHPSLAQLVWLRSVLM